MDDLWTNLFSDYDRVSRKELKRLALDSDFNDGRIDALEAERMRLTERVNRSELLIHAMWELLKVRTGATDEELRVMVARIDLADGREDGKIGTKVPSAQCANCGRPINTRRRNCIYCDAPMSEAYKVSQPKKVVRTVTCTRCSTSVPERDSYFSESGLLCAPCYASPPNSEGGLSLSTQDGGELSSTTDDGGLSEA